VAPAKVSPASVSHITVIINVVGHHSVTMKARDRDNSVLRHINVCAIHGVPGLGHCGSEQTVSDVCHRWRLVSA
jgi:hypothetical protein